MAQAPLVVGSVKWNDAVLTDITDTLLQSCKVLSEQQLVKPENFTLADAMSAVNMLDVKMDVGMLHRHRRLIDIEQAVATTRIKLCGFTQLELTAIMDRSIAMLVLWLRGEPPQLTILANVYLQDIDRIQDSILRGFFHLYVNVALACRRVLLAANAFDNEDFQPNVVNVGNKSPEFLPRLSTRMRSFWDGYSNECDENDDSLSNSYKSVESVANYALEAAFANQLKVDRRHSRPKSVQRVTVNSQQNTTTGVLPDALVSGDDEFALAIGITARLRMLNYWHQAMLLRHLTGDPGYDVSSPLDYMRTCESLACVLEVIADSIAVAERFSGKRLDNKNLLETLDENDSHATIKRSTEAEQQQKVVDYIRRGQRVMGFDYLLNLECMDYPRLTFPDLSAKEAYRYIEQTFLHLYYCTRQLLLIRDVDNNSRGGACNNSMDCTLEVLQRLVTDGSTQLIDPYAKLDSIKIHTGKSHTAVVNNKQQQHDNFALPEAGDDDDEDDLSGSKHIWCTGNETVFGAFNFNDDDDNNDDDGIRQATSVRPGYHDNLSVTELRPNILVRSILVLQTVAIATRFSPAPDRQTSWYACARDTLMCFCMAPALSERDPFVCNEWSLTPYPRGPKMSIWKFLGIFFDHTQSEFDQQTLPDVTAIREEYDALLQPLIDGASNIIKERIRIFGMNKAVQREACLRLVSEIAVYETRANHVDARFQALFEDVVEKLASRLVAKPMPILSSSVSGRSKQRAVVQHHVSAAGNRPSNEQISTLRRTFDYSQVNSLSAWFAYQLSDVLAQAFTLSLELGLYSSGNGINNTRGAQQLEYIYWYQAQHVFRHKLLALSQGRAALQHNRRAYRNNVQSFISKQASMNYARIAAALLLAPSSSPDTAPVASSQQQHNSSSSTKAKPSSRNNKKSSKHNNTAVAESTSANDRAQKAAAEVAVRNEHRVLATFAQRKLADIEHCAAVGAAFLNRQLHQSRVIAHVCTAFAFTIRLLRLLNVQHSGDTVISIDDNKPAAADGGGAKKASSVGDDDKLQRLDTEELSFYHRLFPYNLAPEMHDLYFCSYERWNNDTNRMFNNNYNNVDDKLVKCETCDTEEASGTHRADDMHAKATTSKALNNTSNSGDTDNDEQRQQQIKFFLSALPSFFQRIEFDLMDTDYSAAAADPAVVATSQARSQYDGVLENDNVRLNAAGGDMPQSQVNAFRLHDDILWLYDNALRQTLVKICRYNRAALATLNANIAENCAPKRVTLDFTECSAFPVIRLV